ncbi:MAG: rhodanese-like domain-containing protein [Candidatus Competibacterales bacterium]
MAEFLDFAARHWYLFAALFAILGLLIGTEVYQSLSGVKGVNPAQTLQLINHDDALVVDLRGASDYRGGHIQGAVNIPSGELKDRLKEVQRFKAKPVVVYCQTGTRSQSAGGILKQAGFDRVHHLKGGLQAWRGDNLPVRKKAG